MLIQCFCDQCHGTLVSQQTKRNHQRKQLKTKTASEQLQRRDERVLASTQKSPDLHHMYPLHSYVFCLTSYLPPLMSLVHLTYLTSLDPLSSPPYQTLTL